MFAWILKTKPLKSGAGGFDDAGLGSRARCGGGASSISAAQKRLEAEVGQRAAEEHGGLPAGAVLVAIERGAGARDEVERLEELAVGLLADELAPAADRRGARPSPARRCCPCAWRS